MNAVRSQTVIKPLIIYLDSSDFSELSEDRRRTSEVVEVRKLSDKTTTRGKD